MSAQDRYIETIQEKLGLGGLFAMWPTGKSVRLGDFGRLHDGAFAVDGHLQDYERFDVDPEDEQLDDLTYGSEQGFDVSATVDGAGGIPGTAAVDVALGISLRFHRADQIALRAVGVRYHAVRDKREFGRRIINAYWNRHVGIGDRFVIGFTTAESGAIAVSGAKDATLGLSGRGDVAAGVVPGLGSLRAGISIASATNVSLEVSMGAGFVIAIRLVELDERGVFFPEPFMKDIRPLLDEGREYLITLDEFQAPA